MRNVLKSLVAVTAVFTAASAVRAGIIHYTDQSSGGISVTNITETNDSVANSYYGSPTLVGSELSFSPISGSALFKASSTGANDSDLLDVRLSFDVSAQSSIPAAAFLSEVGDYFGSGVGGVGGDGASILVFNSTNALIASGTAVYNVPVGTTSTIWTNSVAAQTLVLPRSLSTSSSTMFCIRKCWPARFRYDQQEEHHYRPR